MSYADNKCVFGVDLAVQDTRWLCWTHKAVSCWA